MSIKFPLDKSVWMWYNQSTLEDSPMQPFSNRSGGENPLHNARGLPSRTVNGLYLWYFESVILQSPWSVRWLKNSENSPEKCKRYGLPSWVKYAVNVWRTCCQVNNLRTRNRSFIGDSIPCRTKVLYHSGGENPSMALWVKAKDSSRRKSKEVGG